MLFLTTEEIYVAYISEHHSLEFTDLGNNESYDLGREIK